MAVTKVTYSLKTETVGRVQELATIWGVPKSEVIRRAVDQAVMDEPVAAERETPLEIFLRLQTKDGITREAAEKFKAEVRRERRASRRG